MVQEFGRRSTVVGSGRDAVQAVHASSRQVADDQQIQVTVVVRRRAALPDPDPMAQVMGAAELGEKYGADLADLDAVTAAVTAAGARVITADAPGRRVIVEGTYAVLKELFGVQLQQVSTAAGSFRMRTGQLSVPQQLSGVVVAVLGLDDRDQARERVAYTAAVATSYTPVQLGD
ncbi:MAG: protease pro-enzyme activation domain-containing protein, partial [Actinomycetota bacterium]|nr:protease pro-enzyme activation domain-containing protein [Actinomycetota bacterium]